MPLLGSFTGVLGSSGATLGNFVLGAGIAAGPSSTIPLSTIFLTGNLDTPVIHNISHRVGEDKTFEIKIFEGDGVTPLDITGMSFSFTMHTYGLPNQPFYSKNTGAGTIILSDPVNGTLQVICLSTDTTGLRADEYQFFLERTDVGNDFVPTLGLYTLNAR